MTEREGAVEYTQTAGFSIRNFQISVPDYNTGGSSFVSFFNV
jgi:hypothetical protein